MDAFSVFSHSPVSLTDSVSVSLSSGALWPGAMRLARLADGLPPPRERRAERAEDDTELYEPNPEEELAMQMLQAVRRDMGKGAGNFAHDFENVSKHVLSLLREGELGKVFLDGPLLRQRQHRTDKDALERERAEKKRTQRSLDGKFGF